MCADEELWRAHTGAWKNPPVSIHDQHCLENPTFLKLMYRRIYFVKFESRYQFFERQETATVEIDHPRDKLGRNGITLHHPSDCFAGRDDSSRFKAEVCAGTRRRNESRCSAASQSPQRLIRDWRNTLSSSQIIRGADVRAARL
jgi:hypothetical protein